MLCHSDDINSCTVVSLLFHCCSTNFIFTFIFSSEAVGMSVCELLNLCLASLYVCGLCTRCSYYFDITTVERNQKKMPQFDLGLNTD